MRNMLIGAMTAVMVLCAGAATTFAAEPGRGYCYVDTDGDGICDNYGTYGRGRRDGTGCGGNFVDEDGDGICDNRGAGQGRGNGRGYGCHGGRGR